jgi:hypothetical protein
MRNSSYGNETHLFSSRASWQDAFRYNEEKLREKVRKISLSEIEGDLEGVALSLEHEFDFAPPQLDHANITADQIEVEVHRDDYGQRRTYKQAAVEASIPYSGQREAFNLRPSHFKLNAPRVRLGAKELSFRIVIGDRTPEALRSEIDATVDEIQWFLDQQKSDAVGQGDRLLATAKRELAERAANLRKSNDVVAGLGFKSRKG